MPILRQDYALGRLWLALGLFGCGVLVYACLMPNPPQAQVRRREREEEMHA